MAACILESGAKMQLEIGDLKKILFSAIYSFAHHTTARYSKPVEQCEFFEIPNPCLGICKSGPRGYCYGCFRSRDERQYWNNLADPVKRKVVHACALRKRRYQLGQSIVEEGDEPTLQQSLF